MQQSADILTILGMPAALARAIVAVIGASTATTLVQPSGDLTGATDTAALSTTAAQVSAGGGGDVLLAAGNFYLNGPLPAYSGVCYRGIYPRLNFANASIPDSNTVAGMGGGTWLVAASGYSGACFQWNKSVLGVPTANAFVLSGLSQFYLYRLGLNGFTRAVDAGNTNNAAVWYSQFEELYVTACTDWAFWVTNFQHCRFKRIFTFAPVNGGQYYGNDVPQSVLQPGNSVWEDCYNVTPVTKANLSRGIAFNIVQGQQNEGLMLRMQSNRLNSSTVTQAATMANTSTNIGVTDVSQFPVSMPCTVSATANGFNQNEIYFVVSNPGGSGPGNISIALTVGGAAIAATGSTAVNIIQQGYAALEMVAAAGAAISCHDINNLDVEGGGTTPVLLQNVQTSKIELSQTPLNTQSTQMITARSVANSQVFSRASANTSWDGNSGSSQFFGNRATGSVGGGAVAHNPPGFYFDAGDGFTEQNFTASVKGLSNQTPDSSNLIIPLSGIGERMNPKATQAINPNCADTGLVSFTFTTGVVTVTLPTLSATVFGCRYIFANPTANTATVNTGTGQGFNNPAGRTSVTLAQGTSIEVLGAHDANGSYWVVKGIGGVYSAGAVTAF